MCKHILKNIVNVQSYGSRLKALLSKECSLQLLMLVRMPLPIAYRVHIVMIHNDSASTRIERCPMVEIDDSNNLWLNQTFLCGKTLRFICISLWPFLPNATSSSRICESVCAVAVSIECFHWLSSEADSWHQFFDNKYLASKFDPHLVVRV